MNNKSKRYFIMPSVWRTVTDSQVFNWVEVLNEHHIKTDLISLASKDKMQGKDAVDEIEKKINARFYQFRLYPPILNDLILAWVFFKLYIKDFKHFDKIIFQTRVATVGIPLYLIRYFPKVKIVFESRGATIEERKFVHGHRSSLKSKIKEKINILSETLLIEKSDGVICVSNALKEYYFQNFNLNRDSKDYLVIPGAASSHLFYYDRNLRRETRKALQLLPGEIVVVYSGALNQKWEIPEDVFAFLQELKKCHDHYRFLILTPDEALAATYAKKYRLEKATTIINATFQDVNKYLNSSDLALLLREDTPMNHVASPTKFAEYLMCGLPTIISKGVYDFADIVHQTGFGVVLDDYQKVDEGELSRIFNLTTLDRDITAQWAKKNLSKEHFIEDYIAFFEEI